MGIVRDLVKGSIDFVKEEILPLRSDLVKAGILTPQQSAYDQKASLVDPWAYGSVNQGYKEKYSLLDYNKCRQITYADPVVAAVLQTRLNQVAAFAQIQSDKYKMGFKIIQRDDEATPSPAAKKRVREIEQFIQSCGVPENFEDTPELARRDGFETFLRKICRDTLTFDQINFEVTPRNDGKPYSFMAVDASTIRVIPDRKEEVERLRANSTGFDQDHVMSLGAEKFFRVFKPKHPRYAQVINGVIRHVFDEWEMAFGVRNPRTDILSYGYGFSEIEMLVTSITSHMNAETYNRKFFSQGSSIKGILNFEGAVPPDQLEAFRRQWYQQVTGVNNAWRTPILSLGKDSKLNWTSLHSTNREMEFGKWLEYCIKTICGVFQIDPIEIGFDISKQGSGQNSGSGGLGQGNQAERVTFSQDRGLRPLLVFIQQLINDYIVYRIDPNFEFRFVGLNVNSEKDDLDKTVQQVKSYRTINEVRADNDMDPLPGLEQIAKNPGDLVLDPSLITFISGQIAAKQQADQAAQGLGPDGQPLPGDPNDPNAQPGMDGSPVPDDGGDQEEEPDYENMSLDELTKEHQKLTQPNEGNEDFEPANPKQTEAGKAKGKPGKPMGKPVQPGVPPNMMKKSLEIEL